MNECGLDPGIDHMATMQLKNTVSKKGGKIKAYLSYCGGLVSPDSCNNPMGYKFSWSPVGVFRALNNDAKYLYDNKTVEIPSLNLLYAATPLHINNALNLKGYPNRDSSAYKEYYGL